MIKIPRKKLFIRLSFASVFIMAAMSVATILTIKNNNLDTNAATGDGASVSVGGYEDTVYYGDPDAIPRGHTDKWNITTGSETIRAYCGQPSLNAPNTSVTARLAGNDAKYKAIKLAILLDQNNEIERVAEVQNFVFDNWSFVDRQDLSDDIKYAYTHAVIGIIFPQTADYRGVGSGVYRTAVDNAKTRLNKIINNETEYSDVLVMLDYYQLYRADSDTNQQSLLWVESTQEYGKINVQKCDIDEPSGCKDSSKSLAGIKFKVYNKSNKTLFSVKAKKFYANGAEIAEATSDANGRASFANLPVGGTYTVKEIESNEDYILTNETQTVSIETANETKSVTFRNRALQLNTVATDYEDGDHFVEASETATIIDKVEYCVKEGVEYTVKGVMIDKTTGRPLLINGEKIEKTATIKPTEACGSINMVFEFDASDIAGKDLVTYEYLYSGNEEIKKHEDLNDASQTVTIISLATVAEDKATGKKVLPYNKDVEIKDHIIYCLKPGLEYTIKGTLMDKETKNAVLVNSLPVEQTLSFTPDEPCGELDMFYTVNTTDLAGKKLVFFEDLYYGEDLILEHHDYNDYDESLDVMVPPPDTGAFTKSANSNGSINGVVIIAAIAPIISLGVYAGMRRNSRKKFFQK